MDKKNILILAIIAVNIPFFIGVMFLIEKAFDKSKELEIYKVKQNYTGYINTGIIIISGKNGLPQ